MIRGTVNESKEPRVEVTVVGSNGQRTVTAIIDTGLTRHLTLPSGVIPDLGCDWSFREQAVLGSGAIHVFDVFTAEIVWSSGRAAIAILATETTPLIGMSLIAGHRLQIEAVQGGSVILEPL
jgi:predicted aspartyl protease